MARKGRDTIQKHVDQAMNMLDRYMIHLMSIDGIYSGHKITDGEGHFIESKIPEIQPGETYEKYRIYLHQLSLIAQDLQDMTEVMKGF